MEQEQLYLSKALVAMTNQAPFIRGYRDISELNYIILYRVTNISEDCVMLEYFNADNYGILFIPAKERDGTSLKERDFKPRPFKTLTFGDVSVEKKILIICDEVDVVLSDIDNLRKNLYYGASGYLKVNNIDSTLKRTYAFDDDKLTILNKTTQDVYSF
jgi:hypothetical protein